MRNYRHKYIKRHNIRKWQFFNNFHIHNCHIINGSNYFICDNKETTFLLQEEIGNRKRVFLFSKILVFLITGFLFPYFAYPATLVPLKVKCEQGQKKVLLPIDLKTESSERISGIQFDIVIPSGTKITSMSLAESTQRSNKMVSYNQIKNQTYRTIIAGLNQQPIPEGTILFVNIAIEDSTLSGKQLVKLLNPVLADPEGNSVNCAVLPGEILFPGDNSSSDLSEKAHSPSPIEETNYLNAKSIRIVLILTFVFVITVGIITRQIIKKRKKDAISKKQGKKHRK